MISPISLHAIAHGLVLSGVSSPCRRAWRACAFARHTAQHAALHSMQPPHVQASSPGRDCRERMREANAEGKIEGCGTTVRVKPRRLASLGLSLCMAQALKPRAATIQTMPN